MKILFHFRNKIRNYIIFFKKNEIGKNEKHMGRKKC